MAEETEQAGGAGSLDARVAELERRLGKETCAEAMKPGKSGHAGGHGASGVWGLGMAIAVVLSWARNASILWAILHGIFSWGYVIYWAATRK